MNHDSVHGDINRCPHCGEYIGTNACYDQGCHEDEDTEDYSWECNLCGAEDGKCDYRCPNNDSPYAYLVQNGYD